MRHSPLSATVWKSIKQTNTQVSQPVPALTNTPDALPVCHTHNSIRVLKKNPKLEISTFFTNNFWICITKKTYVSQGKAVTCLRCGGIFDDGFVVNLLLSLMLTELGQEFIKRWDSERERFYDDIEHVLQNTKKKNLLRLAN